MHVEPCGDTLYVVERRCPRRSRVVLEGCLGANKESPETPQYVVRHLPELVNTLAFKVDKDKRTGRIGVAVVTRAAGT
jgi:hypothetical protein